VAAVYDRKSVEEKYRRKAKMIPDMLRINNV